MERTCKRPANSGATDRRASNMSTSGEALAWEHLLTLDPADVCLRAQVECGGSPGRYLLKSFGQEILVSVPDRSLSSPTDIGRLLLEDLGHLSRLSILRYLIHACDSPLAGSLVTPDALPGGEIYARGTHVLPLARIARRFAPAPEEFFRRGERLDGSRVHHGTASLRLFPFPRVPVVLTLWAGDEEFPADCTLLFDASCTRHLPPDILWATAMWTLEAILAEAV